MVIAVATSVSPSEGALPSNSVVVAASSTNSFDPNSGLYTYSYSFTNNASSPLAVDKILLPLNGSSVLDVVTPVGWSSFAWRGGVALSFAATGGDAPPNWVDDGQIPPSPFNIQPGQALSGFSFRSPDPPGRSDFHARGFTDIPEAGAGAVAYDEPGAKPPSMLDPSRSFKGPTTGPRFSEQLGDPSSADGFLTITSPQDGATPPIEIEVTFPVSGVDQGTFKATLNNDDVTANFVVTGATTRRAVFARTFFPLKLGAKNVFLALASGTSASNTFVTDVDRVTFSVK